jgi:hypothetical protein
MPFTSPSSAPSAIVATIARIQFMPTHSAETRTTTAVAQRLIIPPTERS